MYQYCDEDWNNLPDINDPVVQRDFAKFSIQDVIVSSDFFRAKTFICRKQLQKVAKQSSFLIPL